MNRYQQVFVLLVRAKSSWKNYLLKGLLTLAIILPPVGLTIIFKPSLLLYHISLLYLLIVVAIAFVFGRFFAFLATIAAFICLDFFFAPPYYNLSISQPDHALFLLMFLLTAIIVGFCCSEVRKRYHNTRTNLHLQEQKNSEEMVQRAYQMRILYQTSVDTNCQKSFKGQLSVIIQALVESFSPLGIRGCILFLPDKEKKPVLQVMWPESETMAKLLSNTDILATVTSIMFNAANKDVIRLDVDENALPAKNNRYRRIVGNTLQRSHSTQYRVYVLPKLTIDGRVATLLLLAEESADHPSLTKQGLFDWEQPNLHTEFLGRFVDQILSVTEKARLLNEKLEVEMLKREENIHTDLNKWVSHGIRTPLTTIKPEITKAISTVREVDLPDDKLLTSLEKIKNAIDRLDLFVDDLLDMARAKGGILKPRKVVYWINDLVYDTLEELKSVIDERFITIDVPELPALEIDPTQISHVLTNLLENAIRYTPPGSPIEISAHMYGKYIRVDIADHGPGISETEAKHLFDEFYQGHKASSHGKGLGLAVCKALIEAHEGHIWVDNIPGGGTVFRFTLPLPQMKGVEGEQTSATYSRS